MGRGNDPIPGPNARRPLKRKCKKCEKRPADGADGLCSACREGVGYEEDIFITYPQCKRCKERPVDGPDGLCSVCRNEEDDDGPQFQFKQPPCKKCKERPVDGADGLCSVCRNKKDEDPPSTLVEVPDVIGKTRFHARNSISSAGLTPADSRRAQRESKKTRGLESLHDGETVTEQSPEAGEMVPRSTTVTLDYSFAGEIIFSSQEEGGYLGALRHTNENGDLHNTEGPAHIDVSATENTRYIERWFLDGKQGRLDRDLPSEVRYRDDGLIDELWLEDDVMQREGAPAAITRRGDEILEQVFWVARDGDSVIHNEEGPAVIKNYPGQEREEIYFLDGEELSREEWERKREETTTLDGRIEEHLMKEEAESS